jgi:hypothetical protein
MRSTCIPCATTADVTLENTVPATPIAPTPTPTSSGGCAQVPRMLRKTAAVVAVGALVLTGWVSGTPVAGANTGDNGEEGDRNGIALMADVGDGDDEQTHWEKVENLARAVCHLKGEGLSDGDVMQGITKYNGASFHNAEMFVFAAEWHFCPLYF